MDKRTAESMSVFIVGLGLALTVGAYGYAGGVAGRSAGIGAVIACVNWFLLRFLVGRVISGSVKVKAGLVFAVLLKMGALMGLIALLIAAGWVEPIAFVVGLSALVGGLLFGSFLYIARMPGSEH